MSGWLLLKRLIVASASVAWAQLYQMTSPSFLAARTTLLFHSAIAAWNFAGDASGSGAGGRAGAESRPGATRPPTTSPRTPKRTASFIAALLRTPATAGRLAVRR